MGIQTPNGAVESKTEADVFMQELGTSLSFKLVDEKPSVLSSERLVNETGYTYSWQLGQSPILRRGRCIIQCGLDHIHFPSGSQEWRVQFATVLKPPSVDKCRCIEQSVE